ncbi:MAG: hypothetical protein WBV82_29975 [Myxococcaceae bacterium]
MRRLILWTVLLAPSWVLAQMDAPTKAPAPYSLPWQLRTTAAVNVLRTDNSFARFRGADGSWNVTTAAMFLACWKVTPQFAPLLRLGFVHLSSGGSAFVNPVVGGTYAIPLGHDLRLGLFLGLTAPVGMGGGNDRDPEAAAAAAAGILARSAMDNAMFAVNDFTVFPGVGLSWSRSGFTAQLEATVLQLTRVRGDQVQADASKTNFTSGLHLGYFPIALLSIGAELRYQRWLSTPVAVANAPETRDNMTTAFGVRLHPKIGPVTLRPGISLTVPLDPPMSRSDYLIGQLDIPVQF